ncbi:MAG: hypothetical protein ACI3W5_16655 [Faecousia sp.]
MLSIGVVQPALDLLKKVRDPIMLYWGRGQAGKDGRTVTEEEALSVINSYQRIALDWKPFTMRQF